ncbi:ATPase AAA [Nanoarchaeota archaeon]
MYEELILDHQELAKEILDDKTLIEREIPKNELLKYINYPNILSILGVRRSGKTILSLQLVKDKNFIYINFDDERLINSDQNIFNELLKDIYKIKDPEIIIFDEIQNVKGWELFLNRLRYNKKIIITGSNSKLLSSELSTHLTGRHIDFILYPFSFREHLLYKGINIKSYYSTIEEVNIKKELEDYLYFGGFPERYKFGKRYLKTIFDDIVNKDIIIRGKIKKIEELNKLVEYLVSNISNNISIRKIENNLRLHRYTIENWLKLIENSFLIFYLEKFDINLWERIKSSKKVYIIDNGLYNVAGLKISENIGKLMENLVYIELIRRKNYWDNDIEIYFYRDNNKREIDFLIKKRDKIIQLIQVTYSNSFEDIKDREWKNLLLVYDYIRKYNQNPELIIITWDYEDEKNISWFNKKGKIKFIPLYKWLLNIQNF